MIQSQATVPELCWMLSLHAKQALHIPSHVFRPRSRSWGCSTCCSTPVHLNTTGKPVSPMHSGFHRCTEPSNVNSQVPYALTNMCAWKSYTHHHASLRQGLPLRVHPVWLHVLPLPGEQFLLLLALGCQPLLLHMLLHRHTDGAGRALALLVMLQQLTRSNTPARWHQKVKQREVSLSGARCNTIAYGVCPMSSNCPGCCTTNNHKALAKVTACKGLLQRPFASGALSLTKAKLCTHDQHGQRSAMTGSSYL